ncbi:hemolysin family protein [Halorutilales archaeon Cl-col2-1]
MVTVSTVVLLGVGAMVVLMVLSAFFSSSEIAMFSLERHKIESMEDSDDKRAAVLSELRSNPHRLLVTILVGNNVVNIAMSSIATVLFGIYFTNSGLAVTAATVVVSFFVLILGESAPKSYAVENAESWALRISRPLRLSQKVMFPAILFFDYLTRVVNKITGGRSDIETSYITRDEIKGILRTGERQGAIEEDERRMLQRVLNFRNTIAKEVMTPRLDIVAVDDETSLDEILEICIENHYTRLPVYHDTLDHIEGIVDLRDVLRARQTGETLDDIIQPTLHVPETKEIDELLTEMRVERIRLSVVIDEFGSTQGIVSIEDMVEEVVGEIFETQQEEPPIEEVDQNTLVVKGEVNIDEVNETLGVDLPEEGEFETVAGFIYNRMGRLVDDGETIDHDGVRLTIEETEGTRILRVRVEKTESGIDDTTQEPGTDQMSDAGTADDEPESEGDTE